MAIADIWSTLDTTWTIQLRTPEEDWHFVSQAEYTDEQDIHDLGAEMYGGQCEYRPVEITRTPGKPAGPVAVKGRQR